MNTIEDVMRGFVPPKPTHECRCGEGTYRPGLCSTCEAAERAAREALAQLRRALSVIPSRYIDANFADDAIMRQRVCNLRAAEVARTALTGHLVVVLTGAARAGKSTVAAAMLRLAAERGLSIAWAPSLRLAAARAEHRLGQGEPPEVRSSLRANVTCIDDLGIEALSPMSAVLDVVHGRHDAQKAMVVTTGLNRLAIANKYGASVGRRLFEGAAVIDMNGAER